MLHFVYICRIYGSKLLGWGGTPPCCFLKTPKEKLPRTRGKHTKLYLQKHMLEFKINRKCRHTGKNYKITLGI